MLYTSLTRYERAEAWNPLPVPISRARLGLGELGHVRLPHIVAQGRAEADGPGPRRDLVGLGREPPLVGVVVVVIFPRKAPEGLEDPLVGPLEVVVQVLLDDGEGLLLLGLDGGELGGLDDDGFPAGLGGGPQLLDGPWLRGRGAGGRHSGRDKRAQQGADHRLPPSLGNENAATA
jgi:hypothetical protein